MRRMQFRFQRILELKERVEETRKAALGEAVAAMETEKRQLATLQSALDAHRLGTQIPPDTAVDAGLMSLNTEYGRRLEREIGEQFERVRQTDVIVEERRQLLLEAARERQVFEILKERMAAQYRRERRRQEQFELDEVGAQVHERRESS